MDGLTRLKRDRVIGTFSNGNVALLVNMAKRAGLPWDVILSAELVGHYKPDPEVYDAAPRLLGLAPEQVMLVAAHADDLAAARARGLRTAYVHRPDEHGGMIALPATDPHADLTVTSFPELADLLPPPVMES
ncbi:HAD-IA family hydrolase [Pseudonocardia sp. H11422]|uniref:HAD-IA family hydrolase n=1 Tax=Pseudonocardia sp. H11422 TaxID=2835866 RepID=UPI0027E236C8|nr:HAD-IA family hydrolase [Pseudonocardia sp. H11422]